MSVKYALFSGYDYGSVGGTGELIGIPIQLLYFDEIQSAELAIDCSHHWYEIVDIQEIPFKTVQSGSVRDLIRSGCSHTSRYRVEPIPTGDLIVSGQFAMPGLYCRDCGKRLGD